MTYYFIKDLKHSIKIKIEQQDQESVSFKKMIQKTVNAKAKVSLKSSIKVWDLDICWSRGHRSFNSISTSSKVLTQKTIIMKSRFKEFRPKKANLAKKKASVAPQTNVAKFSKHGKKNKKRQKAKVWEHRQYHVREQKEQILATNTNVTDVESKKKYLKIMYYNCNKKVNNLKSCPKPPKNQF